MHWDSCNWISSAVICKRNFQPWSLALHMTTHSSYVINADTDDVDVTNNTNLYCNLLTYSRLCRQESLMRSWRMIYLWKVLTFSLTIETWCGVDEIELCCLWSLCSSVGSIPLKLLLLIWKEQPNIGQALDVFHPFQKWLLSISWGPIPKF